jgi:hypothetical protein
VLASLVFHGCAGIYNVVEFEILEPASVSLPEYVQQLIILNRAPLSMNVLKEEDRKLLTYDQLIILDTLIVNNLQRGLLEVLRLPLNVSIILISSWTAGRIRHSWQI